MPPTHLDGARVLSWAAGDFGVAAIEGTVVIDGTPLSGDVPIVALALAQYEDHPDQSYVFACDADWRVLGDLVYGSITEAQAESERYYGVAPIRWRSA